jgi:hypothetical protein
MAYEKRPNSGTLFTNDKKGNDKAPDRKGDGMVHCPHCSANFDVELAGWIKEGRNGSKFLSMKIASKEDPGAYRGGQSEQSKPAAPKHGDPEDEPSIPF